jgi:hypothetical protein
MIPQIYTVTDRYHLIIDGVILTIGFLTLRLVRRSKYQSSGQWLLLLVLSHAVAFTYGIGFTLLRADTSLQARILMSHVGLVVYLLDTALGVASLTVMIRMFKDVATRFNLENEFKQLGAERELGTWPPPPS